MDWIMTVLRFIHVLFAIVWVGGTAYMVLFLQPGLRRLSPETQRPVMLAVGPRAGVGLLASAFLVYLTGVVMVLRVLGIGGLGELFQTAWGRSIFLGFLMASAMFIVGFAYVIRTIFRLKAMAEAGTPPTPEQARRFQARMRYGAMVALAFGILAVLAMVSARGYRQ